MARLAQALALLLLLTAAACGGGDDGEDGDAAAPTSISITSPEDGATVPSTFPVTMAAEGLTIEPAGNVVEGSGHFHLLVDTDCLPVGDQIPADASHIHLADGARETELTLPPGEHTLCLQAGDGQHSALGLTDEITVRVGEGEDTTTDEEEAGKIEDWFGTYEGEVVWDCGAAGTHRGTLEAEVVILTFDDGAAQMEVEHTVTGSCADTGALAVTFGVTGERTATGFTFPTDVWQTPGPLRLRVNGDQAEGRLSGPVPGPGTMTIVFDLECSFGC